MKLNKIIIAGLTIFTIAATSITAFAITYNTPADIVAKLTGKTADEVTEQRYESNKTYGEIAYDEGAWEEFKKEMLESKKAFLDEKVKDGTLSPEEADAYYKNMLERQEYCTNDGANGKGYGGMMGYGRGMMGYGRGMGFGQGRGWQ